MAELPRGTVTLLFTDIEGSTRLLNELGDAYASVLADHRRVLREAFGRHGGVEVDTQGDAFFYVFARAGDAAAASVDAQAGLEPTPVRVRMGIHTGEPMLTDEGYVGADVHRAARVMSAAHGGQVLVSETTRALLSSESTQRLALRDLGPHRLKDLTAPQHLFQLGDGEFPPPKTLRESALPVAGSPLIGRDDELGELLDLLRDGVRAVTVTGAGGSGKTRLALQAAAELLDDFGDGVFWIPLAGFADPELVLPSIAQTIGASDDVPSYLAERRTLLVLDNFEHLLEAAPSVANLLAAAPRTKMLVTSRSPLRIDGEHEYPVEPLPERAAVTLFVERARAAGRPIDADATVAAICRRLDGLPLALELAAARARLLAPTAMLRRLDQRLPLLAGGRRDAPERQRTLRATIEWSYELLDDEAKKLFARLSVFAGSFSLTAAEQVCGADLDALASLVDLSLIKPIGDDRFLMLETIREYALERLGAADEGALRRRHAEYVLERTPTVDWALQISDAETLDEMERDHDNVRAALAWLDQTGDSDALLDLSLRVSNFWAARGHALEGRRWLDRALAGTEGEMTTQRAKALNRAGMFAERRGDYDIAIAYAHESLAIARELGETRQIANALCAIGVMTWDKLGDDKEAERLLAEATEYALAVGDQSLVAAISGNRGHIASSKEDYRRAIELFEDSAAIFRAEQHVDWLGWALYNLAFAWFRLDRIDEAVPAALESIVLIHKAGESDNLIWLLGLLAAIAVRNGRPEVGATLVGAADALRDQAELRLSDGEAKLHEETMRDLQRLLRTDELAMCLSVGKTMSAAAAVEYALASTR